MKKAFVYLRKSIERESEKSIERQWEDILEYAIENEIEIVKEFAEVASSATLQRAELQRMMKELESRSDIDYILIYSFDRISREMHHFGWLISQLTEILRVKTRVHSITESNDYDDDHYKLFMIMMRTFGATEERVRIVSRLQGARQSKQQKGGFIGGVPPFGYATQEGSGLLFIKHSEVPTVQHAFEWRIQGLTMQGVADKLNEYGFKTRQGREFKAMTVQRMLKNEGLYKGEGEAPQLLKTLGEYKMKQLKDLYEGIQFYQKDGKEGTYYGVSKDKIEKQANLIGTILIREEDVYTPCDWNTNSEEFFIDEDEFNEYSYVLMNHEADDIYHALEEKYEDIFSKHGIEDKWDFISAEELPTEIYEELLQLIKEKDYKADFEQWEPTYSYFDGHNSQKISLNEYNGYYPCELDYVVKKGYRIDGNTSHSIFYLTTEGTVIEDYNSYFQGDESKHFHMLRIVEKDNWGNVVKEGYEIEM